MRWDHAELATLPPIAHAAGRRCSAGSGSLLSRATLVGKGAYAAAWRSFAADRYIRHFLALVADSLATSAVFCSILSCLRGKFLMLIALDILLFTAITTICWRGYRYRSLWLAVVGQLLARLLCRKGFWGQLFSFAPIAISWLLLCHWVNTAGWHATAAGGILLAMTVGLDAMRNLEEKQKMEKSSCEK